MNELVSLKGNEVFTNSLIISEGTKVAHRYIKEQLRKYENRFKTFGLLVACATESTGGRPEEQLVRDKEIEQSVIAIYRKMEREGKLIAAWKKGI